MKTMCQRILWSCLIHFIGTVGTDYFSLLIAITEQYPYFLLDSSLIAIINYPWLLPGQYQYIATYQFFHLHEEDRSHILRQNKFTYWNSTWYRWVGKTFDVVAYNIISMYYIDKTNNRILKITLFHTPASHVSQNRHDTMGRIAE